MNCLDIAADILVFLLAAGSTFAAIQIIELRYKRYVLAKRFNLNMTDPGAGKGRFLSPQLEGLAQSIGRLAAPKSEDELSALAKKLSYAGYRNEHAAFNFYGAKIGLGGILTVFFLAGQILFHSVSAKSPVLAFIPFAVGYYLPNLVLKKKVKTRIGKIFKELPDTLDLLEICLKAGLGFDYALLRVCNELKVIAPVMSVEFERYFLEIKTGVQRDAALINIGERNGSEPLKKVVTVLLQSSKIGTDITQALKTYTDTMRREREQTAEEMGAKLSTKLTVPLVLFILPALMLIILGPVIINFISLINQGF